MDGMQKKKTLVLVTETFPWGTAETPFLSPELPYLAERYRLILISRALPGDYAVGRAAVDERIRVLHYPHAALSLPQKLAGALGALLSPVFRREAAEAWRAGRPRRARLAEAWGAFVHARRFARWLEKEGLLPRGEDFIYYSYWYTYSALAMALLREKYPRARLVTRAHGYDFIEEANPAARAYKWFVDPRADRIILASQYGLDYYRARYATGRGEKYALSRLGQAPARRAPRRTGEPFCLVSCARAVPVKRLDRLVDALALVDGPLRWVHFGGGAALEALRERAARQLDGKAELRYELRGDTPNPEVLAFYDRGEADCAILTSASEGGCPVALQEALARGIPVIGPAVGGITEMIDGNGILLSADPAPEEIAGAISAVRSLSPTERAALSDRAAAVWEEMFSAERAAPRLCALLEGEAIG